MATGYKVELLKVATGERRTVNHTATDWEDHSLFWWEQGDFSCDCNRQIVWAEAGGEPEIADDDLVCGDEAFRAIKAILPDGTEIEIQGEECQP